MDFMDIFHILFIHSSIDGHGLFPFFFFFFFFAILNNNAMNIIQFWFGYMLLFFLSMCRVDFLGHIVTLCLTFEEMTDDKLFSKAAAPFCILK